MSRQGHIYSFTGRVIPHWVVISSNDIEGKDGGAGDCPSYEIKIHVEGSVISGILTADVPFENLGTLWNVIESRIRYFITSIAFINGARIDAYVDSIRDESCGVQLQLESVAQELAQLLGDLGVTHEHMNKLLCDRKYEYHLGHAMFHARQALSTPGDAALNGYRAIETLRNYFVDSIGIARDKDGKPPKDAWQKFREHYNLDERKMKRLADLSSPLRHGNYRAAVVLDGKMKPEVLQDIWYVIATFIKVECAKN